MYITVYDTNVEDLAPGVEWNSSSFCLGVTCKFTLRLQNYHFGLGFLVSLVSQGLPYVTEIIRTELISRHHDDPLAGHFGIEKTRELVAQKYYWPSLRHDIEAYVKGCDDCLASKAVRHKPYSDLQSLLVPTHPWKDLYWNSASPLDQLVVLLAIRLTVLHIVVKTWQGLEFRINVLWIAYQGYVGINFTCDNN